MIDFIESYKKQVYKSGYPFEDFLKEIHAKNYTGTDDDMPEMFDLWITELDLEDVIGFGNQALNLALGLENKDKVLKEQAQQLTYEKD
jgi:hypothetical protein